MNECICLSENDAAAHNMTPGCPQHDPFYRCPICREEMTVSEKPYHSHRRPGETAMEYTSRMLGETRDV